ncbi:hypothetical protein EVAR_95124_1 [Eumeta japonica]|uniref:Uncharacterized protein n=1 Tax=Eumeta variegata TaxID=151549 RepID=A0A4C1W8D6_EUMVA|nr:hypothetical protein EVAR_95124_1 [Eumeta japonica]
MTIGYYPENFFILEGFDITKNDGLSQRDYRPAEVKSAMTIDPSLYVNTRNEEYWTKLLLDYSHNKSIETNSSSQLVLVPEEKTNGSPVRLISIPYSNFNSLHATNKRLRGRADEF